MSFPSSHLVVKSGSKPADFCREHMRWKLCSKLLMFHSLVFSTTLDVSKISSAQETVHLRRESLPPFQLRSHLHDARPYPNSCSILKLRDPSLHSRNAVLGSILRGGSSTLEMAAAAHEWLQYSFSPNQQEREQAETALRSLEAQPGFLPALLTIVNRYVDPIWSPKSIS